jgi:ABC-type Fe3+ transport system substrate-binding protein
MNKLKYGTVALITAIALFVPVAVHADDDWKRTWDKAVAEGKKEGEVILYGGYNPIYREYTAKFERKYPGIKVNFIPGGGAQHAVRILAERRAGKYLADVVMGGASTFQSYPKGTFEPMRNFLILPEVTDTSAWFGGSLSFVDPERKYVLSAMGSVGQEIAYNTKLVKPDEIRAWSDLLDPKWKGKILRHARRSVSSSFIFFYHNPKLGPTFLSRLLKEADVGVTRNLRQGVNWLAEGKYVLYLDGTPQSIDEATKRGLPVAIFPHPLKEGQVVSGSYCCMAVLDKVPHPNATKVFINWVLSKEGQLLWQTAVNKNSLRVDIPKNGIPTDIIPKKGVEYFHVDRATYQQPKDLEAIKKIEAQAKKGGKGK